MGDNLGRYWPRPRSQAIFDNLIDLKPDGSFRLHLDNFDLAMTNKCFDTLFGVPPRKPEVWLTQRDMDLAASIQAVTEEVVLRLARTLIAETGMKQMCLAGVAARRLHPRHLDPACCSRRLWRSWAQHSPPVISMRTYHACRPTDRAVCPVPALGPAFEQRDIEQRLTAAGFARMRLLCLTQRRGRLPPAKQWARFQGRMEFGPRALVPALSSATRARRACRDVQSQGQISRGFPPVCAGGAAPIVPWSPMLIIPRACKRFISKPILASTGH
jgi:carbamoyltransferase